MSDEEILAWLADEYAKPFVGWDFSYLSGRRHTIDDDKPWDLASIARARLQAATAVLDVDTGDGRRFADALAGSRFRGRASATEGYAPNVPLARATLIPLGVDVRDSHAEHLPIADASFDLVLNRHGDLDAAETRRVLQPDGWLGLGFRNPLQLRVEPLSLSLSLSSS